MIALNGHKLSIEDIIKVAVHGDNVHIHDKALEKVQQSRDYIEKQVEQKNIIYGVTTGFGYNASKVIEDSTKAKEMQKKLLLSHACGVGVPFDEFTVRAIMLIRLNTLLAGYSGVKTDTVLLLKDLINNRIHPYIPSQGSVGASGDLCPLAHMALTLIGEGFAYFKGEKLTSKEALDQTGLRAIELEHKEGIALTNGTTVMAALGALAIHQAESYFKLSLISIGMAMEAIGARKQAFDDKVHAIRKHAGQIQVAKWINKILDNSTLFGIEAHTLLKAVPDTVTEKLPEEYHLQLLEIKSGIQKKISKGIYAFLPKEKEGDVWNSWENLFQFIDKKITPQDAYSIRCIPQVFGASWNALQHVRKTIENELNAVVDNPLVFVNENEVLSAGNFHGQPLALVLDYLKLAIAELGNILERQINKLVDESTNDALPAFLVEDKTGLNSGLMIPQYTAASLVSENKVLVHPASADSIPTCANKEDHVSMGTIAGRQAIEIINNFKKIIAIHMLTAAQALDLRQRQLKKIDLDIQLGKLSHSLYQKIRNYVPYLQEDTFLYDPIRRLLDNFDELTKLNQEIKS